MVSRKFKNIFVAHICGLNYLFFVTMPLWAIESVCRTLEEVRDQEGTTSSPWATSYCCDSPDCERNTRENRSRLLLRNVEDGGGPSG